MGKNIKGITIEIGGETTAFKKAMNDMSSVTRTTQNELNAVNKSLKFDPKNVDLLKQKEQLLAKQIEDTKIKVEKLKAAKAKADTEMANGTEINQEQYRILVREISATEGQLKSLIRQNDKFGNGARALGEKLDGIGKKGMAVSGTIIGIGTAAVGAMSAAAEETREYREDMNKLETAFKTGGFTVDAAKKSYEDFFVVLGETDRSVEAVSHLARFVTTEQDLVKWSDIAAGVTATFGDSLPIEGLTEAANETAKVGQVTGVLADALNWVRISEEEFNKELEKCNSEQERAELITTTLDGAYKDAATTYKEVNADIIANRRATSESNEQMAKLGESTEAIDTKLQQAKNTISTAVLPVIGKVADKVSNLDEKQIKLIGGMGAIAIGIPALIVGAGKVVTAIGTISTACKALTVSSTAASVAMKAIPFIGIAALAVGAIGAIAGITKATNKESDSYRTLHEEASKRLEDYRSLKKECEQNVAANLAELEYTEELKEKLIALADENGRVEDSERTRAEFILNHLNETLGTTYKLTGNQIEAYDGLCESIDKLIVKEKAEVILAGKKELFEEATKNIKARKEALEESYKGLDYLQNRYNELESGATENDPGEKSIITKLLTEKKKEIEKAKELYDETLADIEDYQNSYMALAEGREKDIVAEWENYTTVLDTEQKKVAEIYSGSLVELSEYAEKYKKGVEGYTLEGLEVLKSNVALSKIEAEKIGVSINEGMVVGLSDQDDVKTAITKLCESIPSWAKTVLGINSPAKVAIPIGEAIPQGIGVGIEKDMSAEEALEKKCSNLKKILSDYTSDFKVDIKLAESEYKLWESENPNANDDIKRNKEREMLVKTAEGQTATVQTINDALWHQGQLTGEESPEYKQMLADLNNAKADLNETNEKILKLDMYLPKEFSEENVDLAESQYILWKARNPNATEYEDLVQQEKKLNVEYGEQGKKVQDLNDELYITNQLYGESSEESKKLLIQLNKEKAAYEELAREIASVNEQKAKHTGSGGYVPGGSAASKYAAYHSQYGAMLKSQGVSQEAVDAAARKVSGYSGEKSINVNNYISGVTPDTPYKVSQETVKGLNNLSMQGVL